jgi:hypothetical protein
LHNLQGLILLPVKDGLVIQFRVIILLKGTAKGGAPGPPQIPGPDFFRQIHDEDVKSRYKKGCGSALIYADLDPVLC